MTQGVIVMPWKRGQRERLYVKDANSRKAIGWVDCNNYFGELNDENRATEFLIALRGRGIPRQALLKIIAESEPTPNEDLSRRRPGDMALKKASEVLAGLNKTHTELVRKIGYASPEESWVQGAEGEKIVGFALEEELGPEYKVLHSVPIGSEGSDIDHIVFGPTGIYTINTKSHPGSDIFASENEVVVKGRSYSQKQPYARNSRFEARRVDKIIRSVTGVPVTSHGIIAYIAKNVIVLRSPKDAKITNVNADYLVQFIKSRPVVLTADEVETIYQKMRWSDAWKK